MSRRRRRVAFRDYIPMDLKAMAKEYEEEGRRSRRHSSPCNSREGSTTALHTQHYDDAVSITIVYKTNLVDYDCFAKPNLHVLEDSCI
ncbi:unnamed protein product [Pieris brassicae]|uniref:Uncharacterized protein n=1 Tax=Pieris brassicae TaxID=7116 RepID=A0A9P0T5M6_PIEBR|nr:unnamed protein product [Pieris brassicae]